ncbi:MAG: heme-binding protein [Clostridiales bacterium]|nr:heme-binding protein [Clostridiales bacterium]
MSIDIEKLVGQVVREIYDGKPTVKREKRKIDRISLDDAKFLAEKVEEEARRIGVRAVVAIADDGGNLKLLECMDDSFIASRDIAINKAYTSVSLKISTKKLASLAAPGGSLYGIQHTNGGRIVIFGGGETLDLSGKIVGGLGVSGGTEEEDTALAAFGKKIFDEYFV